MADVVRLGATAALAATGQRGGQATSGGRAQAGPAFRQVLAATMAKGRMARSGGLAGPGGIQPAAWRALSRPGEKPSSMIPAQSAAALVQAMRLEGVPDSWQDGLRFIMAQESGGRVGVRNPVHSARGLFQLTAAHYHLNPNGARSFGNAVEEAQGGIRYIQKRYGSAENAVAFWRAHHWY